MSGAMPVVLSLALQVMLQLFSVAMVPLSKGFTRPLPAIGSVVAFGLALFLLARLQQTGVNLSLAIPLLSAMVPLASVAIMLIFYGEVASPLKIVLLVAACLLIGAAAKFG